MDRAEPPHVSPPEPVPGERLRGRPLSEVLLAIATDTSRERVKIADLLAAMGDRAIGALMFVFALPNVIPMPPGTSSILGLPLVLLTAQLALGKAPWLPKAITQRSLARSDFAVLVRRVGPWLLRAEKLLKPRLGVLARPPAEYAVGVACLLLAVVLALPIPFGNMLPAIAICLFSLGVLERDGLWILAGGAVGLAGVALVWGFVYALVEAAIYLFVDLSSG